MNLVLANATLADGRRVDVHVLEGLIDRVTDIGSDGPPDALVHDLDGWLLLPAMAEVHAHLDKALTAERVPNPGGDLEGAIEGWNAVAAKGSFTYEDTLARASRAMARLLVHGVTAVRTHVMVGREQGIEWVRALNEARTEFDDLLDMQIVAMPHRPLTGPDGIHNRACLEEAARSGVDLIGGAPELDPDPKELIRIVLATAMSAGLGVDLHTDETLDPAVLTLREIARQVQETGFDGLVAASHCVSLGMQTLEVQAEVAAEVAAAGIAVLPQPQTNLFLQGRRHSTAQPRGLTAIRALQDAGVLVAAGGDNVQDPFNPLGRSDPLETAALLVMAGHVPPDAAYRMVSNDAREVIGLPRVDLQSGDRADLLAIDAPSVRGAIADSSMSRRVYRHGRLVASADQTTSVHRHDPEHRERVGSRPE